MSYFATDRPNSQCIQDSRPRGRSREGPPGWRVLEQPSSQIGTREPELRTSWLPVVRVARRLTSARPDVRVESGIAERCRRRDTQCPRRKKSPARMRSNGVARRGTLDEIRVPEYDDAVVGAGILGLAHAYHLARRGRQVVVLERRPDRQGASVRNFGMLWPIGQPFGELRDLARRSLTHWLEVLASSGLWHRRTVRCISPITTTRPKFSGNSPPRRRRVANRSNYSIRPACVASPPASGRKGSGSHSGVLTKSASTPARSSPGCRPGSGGEHGVTFRFEDARVDVQTSQRHRRGAASRGGSSLDLLGRRDANPLPGPASPRAGSSAASSR